MANPARRGPATPRVLHVAADPDGRVAAAAQQLDGVLGTHRLVAPRHARAAIRRSRPDLVVAHGAAAAVMAAVGRPAPPVVHHGTARTRLGQIAARHGAATVEGLVPVHLGRWRDLVTGLLGPVDAAPAMPRSLDDVLVPLPHAVRRSAEVRLVAGPDPAQGPLVLQGPAAGVFDRLDGRRSLAEIAEALAAEATLDTAAARALAWDVAQRACRARIVALT